MFVGAALHAELGGAVDGLIGGELGIGGNENDLLDGVVGFGEGDHGGAFGGNAHAGADHVDLLVHEGGHDAVPVHGLMRDFKAHVLGDPVHGVHVEAGGFAVFADVGEGRIVGVDAVDVGFRLSAGGHAEHGEGRKEAGKTFHVSLTKRLKVMIFPAREYIEKKPERQYEAGGGFVKREKLQANGGMQKQGRRRGGG